MNLDQSMARTLDIKTESSLQYARKPIGGTILELDFYVHDPTHIQDSTEYILCELCRLQTDTHGDKRHRTHNL